MGAFGRQLKSKPKAPGGSREYWALVRSDGRIATKRGSGAALIFASREEAQGWLSPSRSGPVKLIRLREVETRTDAAVMASGAAGRMSIRFTVLDPTDKYGGGKHVRLEEARQIVGQLLAKGVSPAEIRITRHVITNEPSSVMKILGEG